MPVLSLCQEPLLECHMRGSRSSLPASCLLLLPRSFTLLRPFAFVWHVHHRLIPLPVCPWSAYKVLEGRDLCLCLIFKFFGDSHLIGTK